MTRGVLSDLPSRCVRSCANGIREIEDNIVTSMKFSSLGAFAAHLLTIDYRRAGQGFRAGDEARAVCGLQRVLAALRVDEVVNASIFHVGKDAIRQLNLLFFAEFDSTEFLCGV
jgi:hypothetical protein